MAETAPLPTAFTQALAQTFSLDFLHTDSDTLKTYGRDWTRLIEPHASGVVFPRSTAELSKLLKLCSDHQVPVVPSGGRTGLAAGALAANGELVVSLEKLNFIHPVDTIAHTVRVGAGAVTQAVHEACAPHGLTWPVDFASKGSSQVGGNIATNAGGVKVIQYGLTREWVLGLTVVLMSGEVLELNGALEKNNTGLDLRQLFIGTEGTLGIVSEATLRLTRMPADLDVMFFALADVPSVLKLFERMRASPFPLFAFEFLRHECLDAVMNHRKLRSPFAQAHPVYVLAEIERAQTPEAQASVSKFLEDLFNSGLVLDGTLAQTSRETRELWELREGISESLSALGLLHKNDIALPIAKLESFIAEFLKLFTSKYPDLKVFLFGHIGDGNLHVNVLKPESMPRDEFVRRCKATDQELFQLLREHQGSVSAEHGIGLLKKEALPFSRSPQELTLFRQFKSILDPLGLLNPGKIL